MQRRLAALKAAESFQDDIGLARRSLAAAQRQVDTLIAERSSGEGYITQHANHHEKYEAFQRDALMDWKAMQFD